MESLPTIEECTCWILEHCQILLSLIKQDSADIKDLIQTTYESTKILIHALDNTKMDKSQLLTQLERYIKPKQNTHTLKMLILTIKDICCQVKAETIDNYLSITTSNYYRESTRIFSWTTFKDTMWPDQIDEKAGWFRHHFVGKPYMTLIGPIQDDVHDLAVISIVKEYQKEANQKQPFIQYRIIVRTKQDFNMGFIVQEADAKELILQLEESLGQTHAKLNVDLDPKRHRPLRSFSSAIITSMTHSHFQPPVTHTQSTKVMRAAILFLFQDVKFNLFKELSAECTILAGLEKEFLRYDEIGIPKSYKFGVISIQKGQTTEEEWFSNSGLSVGLEKLLNIIGKPMALKGYKGYAAGLDTKTGESGDISYVSAWKEHDIMFHVAPLMPSRKNDIQQVHRKRYIGNDIVCIVFIEEEGQQFDPNSIRSKFLHVFILVYWNIKDGQDTWRVEVIYKTEVKSCSPHIPSPPIFTNENDLAQFLILKLINTENASLKSDNFTVPNNKARLDILKGLIHTGLEASAKPTSRHHSKYHHDRPKSAGAQQRHVKSEAITRSITPELPPVPSLSRSNVLRDIKSLARRRSQQNYRQQQSSPPITNRPAFTSPEILENNEKKKPLECLDEDPAMPVQKNNIMTTTSATATGIRYKAHNLMSTMIGRRNSRTGLPNSS